MKDIRMTWPLKTFLLLAIVAIFALGGDRVPSKSKQMVKIFDAQGTRAKMARYEKRAEGWVQIGDSVVVNIGRNGLGKTKEGDGKTPVGVYPLDRVYAYHDLNTSMPLFRSDENLLCVDDADSRYYNRIVDRRRVIEDFNSYETMKRNDDLYEMLVTVGYNPDHIPGRGSCIFIHVADGDKPTAGCISMKKSDLEALIKWLDPHKRPVIIIERWIPDLRFASLKVPSIGF